MKFRLNEGPENIYDKAQDLFNKIESWEYSCYDSYCNCFLFLRKKMA